MSISTTENADNFNYKLSEVETQVRLLALLGFDSGLRGRMVPVLNIAIITSGIMILEDHF
jgi:hypothetical protein